MHKLQAYTVKMHHKDFIHRCWFQLKNEQINENLTCLQEDWREEQVKPHSPIVFIGSAAGRPTELITKRGETLEKARNRNLSGDPKLELWKKNKKTP